MPNWYVDYINGDNTNYAGDSFAVTASGSDCVCNGSATVTMASGAFDASYVNRKIILPTKSTISKNINTVVNATTLVLNSSTSAGTVAWCVGGAWRDLVDGASTSRITAGDTIKIAKSPDPYTIGTCSWTARSKTVTLSDARTLTIDNCETAWTGSNSATIARTAVGTDGKQGSYSMKITTPASVATTTLYAFYPVGTIDCSAYQKVSFWIKNESAILANMWDIVLCSDTDGTTAVDTISIPALPADSAKTWTALNIARDGGSNLGATICSVALYSGTVAPTASKYIYLDNIIATKDNDLNLTSLISKSSSAIGGTEGWYPIQSIDGTTVLIDNYVTALAGQGRGYSGGTNAAIESYAREVIPVTMIQTQGGTLTKTLVSGTRTSRIVYEGGCNTTTGNVDGATYFSGQNGYGIGFNHPTHLEYNEIRNLGFTRYYYGIRNEHENFYTYSLQSIVGCYAGIYINETGFYNTDILSCDNCYNGIYNGGGGGGIFVFTGTINSVSGNLSSGFNFNHTGNIDIEAITNITNNNGYGMDMTGAGDFRLGKAVNVSYNTGGVSLKAKKNIIGDITLSTNTNDLYFSTSNGVAHYIDRLTTTSTVGTTAFLYRTIFNPASNAYVFINNINNTYYGSMYSYYGIVTKQSSIKEDGTNYSLKFSPDSQFVRSASPLELPFGNGFKVACVADKEVTFTVRMYKDHATRIAGGIKLITPQLGITGTKQSLMTDTADTWETVTLTFTPTEAGVVEITPFVYYIDSTTTYTYSVYFGTITVSQAS